MNQPQPGPHELRFVLGTPAAGTVSEHPGFDLYRPDGADRPRPAVVVIPGAVPPGLPVRPRHWPVYEGYGRIIADRGAYAAVVDQPFHDMTRWPLAAADLATIIESVRKQPDVDGDRIAIWAFSAGALLVGGWLAASPDWLRCLALTYPVLALPDAPTPPVPPADLVGPGRPVVLTRVGKEEPARQATVDRFLARAHDTGTTVQVVDVPDGRHGFDMIDHTEQSRNAVRQAIDLVIGHLLG